MNKGIVSLQDSMKHIPPSSSHEVMRTGTSDATLLVENTKEQLLAVIDAHQVILYDDNRHESYPIVLKEPLVLDTEKEIQMCIEREIFEKHGDIMEVLVLRGNILSGALVSHLSSQDPQLNKWIATLGSEDRRYFGPGGKKEENYVQNRGEKFLSFSEGMNTIIEALEKNISSPEIQKQLLVIAGPSGSGKTKLMEALAEYFDEGAVEVSTDAFYKGVDQMTKEDVLLEGVPNFDDPRAIDHKGFVAAVTELLKGQPVTIPTYDFESSMPSTCVESLSPKPQVFVEGIFDLREEFLPDLQNLSEVQVLKVAVFVELFELLLRRIKRDMVRKAHSPVAIFKYIKEFVEPAYTSSIIESLATADIHIHNTHGVEYA